MPAASMLENRGYCMPLEACVSRAGPVYQGENNCNRARFPSDENWELRIEPLVRSGSDQWLNSQFPILIRRELRPIAICYPHLPPLLFWLLEARTEDDKMESEHHSDEFVLWKGEKCGEQSQTDS